MTNIQFCGPAAPMYAFNSNMQSYSTFMHKQLATRIGVKILKGKYFLCKYYFFLQTPL